MAYVIKQVRKAQGTYGKIEDYPIAKYTMDTFNFLGPAHFDTEEEAYLYLEWYKDVLEHHKSEMQKMYERPRYKIVEV